MEQKRSTQRQKSLLPRRSFPGSSADRKLSEAVGSYRFKRIKIIERTPAALIPFVSAFNFQHMAWVSGGLGVVITVLEGMLHLNQYEQNWITYRSTSESLKHEKYVYLGKAGPYVGSADAHALLADRVESLVSQEHAKWASVQQQPKPSAG